VENMLMPILAAMGADRSKPMLLLVNGLGGTPLIEQYALCAAAVRRLAADGVVIARTLVGGFVTSLNMPGCSLTLAAMDDELLALWDAPVVTANLRWRG
jgi:phosphoenolpyruvate---glycerone phosphotransferase subunit DhaK